MSLKIKRFLVIAILTTAVIFLWIELFLIIKESQALANRSGELSGKLNVISSDNSSLKDDIMYYSNPLNLEKALRERFNYKKPSENMIIVVPQ